MGHLTGTQTISNAVTKKSRFLFSNHAGVTGVVDSLTTSTVTLKSKYADQLTGKTLYAAGTPGILVILDGVNASDAGKTANITGVSGDVLTVDVDFSTTPALADGSLVAVVPPMSFAPKLQSGHTFNANPQNLKDKGLTDTFDSHNTPGMVDPGGGFTAFMTTDSMGLVRIMAALVGTYKISGTVHSMVPPESNDGTYTECSDLSVMVSDGDGVSDELYYALFASSGSVNFPEAGLPTVSAQTMGAGAVREVGGSGKEFPSGANNFDRTGIPADQDPLFTFTDVFIEMGGTFGDALTAAVDQAITAGSADISRGSAAPRPLGNGGYTAKPVETEHGMVWNLTRTYEDDAFRSDHWGDAPRPAKKVESRFILKAFDPSDSAKYFEIDVPRAIVETHEPQRNGQGLMVESITVEAKHTLDGNKNPDTANPLYRVRIDNGLTTNALTAI